jgi:hypothetical protein
LYIPNAKHENVTIVAARGIRFRRIKVIQPKISELSTDTNAF